MAILLKQEKITEIINSYKRGTSIIKTSKITGVSESTILKYLKLNNIKRRTTRETSRKDFFNFDYFETIDTPAKAYFLGLLYADGNVCIKNKRKVVQICLENIDIYILKLFQKEIGSTNPLCLDRIKYSKLTLYSDKMVNDLIKIGCTPIKSLNLQFPKICDNLLWHFIRGYFDGDGSVSKNGNNYSINFTSSKDFMNELFKIFHKNNLLTNGLYKRYKEKAESAYTGYIKNKSAHQFYNLLYENCEDLYLTRKKEKFTYNE